MVSTPWAVETSIETTIETTIEAPWASETSSIEKAGIGLSIGLSIVENLKTSFSEEIEWSIAFAFSKMN